MEYRSLVLESPMKMSVKRFDLADERNVKMIYSGVCGTDKHAIKGQLDMKLPVILGHENVGELEGQRVTWPTIIPCNKCASCKIGMENVCERNKLFGITTRDPLVGGWSEYATLPDDTVIFPIPDSLSDDAAVLIETMASTKSLNQVDIKSKDLLIIGSGPIGLLSAVHAKERGVGNVAIVGHKDQTSLIGNTVDMFYEKGTPVEDMEHKFDIVMDAGGNSGSLEYSVQAVMPRGAILESGCMTKNMDFDISKLVKKELRMFTQLGYVPMDFKWATDIVERNQKLLRNVITHKFKLDEYEKAMDVMFNSNHGKIMFSL